MNYVSLINGRYFGVINFHLQGKEVNRRSLVETGHMSDFSLLTHPNSSHSLRRAND